MSLDEVIKAKFAWEAEHGVIARCIYWSPHMAMRWYEHFVPPETIVPAEPLPPTVYGWAGGLEWHHDITMTGDLPRFEAHHAD